MPRAHLTSLASGYDATVQAGLESVGFFARVPARGTVLLKPNLTYPVYRPGVMTSFECLRSVTHCLRDRGYEVIIAESDGGGYNPFSMDAVFEGLGIPALAAATGARVVNLSHTEPARLSVNVGWRQVAVRIPRLLLEGIDAFVSLPVPKIHMNTLVSLSIKNQWGCIQADDLVAADRLACRLLRIDPEDVAYLRHFRRCGWWCEEREIALEGRIEDFQREQFYLVREWTDMPGVACFNNSALAWLGYHSPVAGLAHRLLYLFRKPFYDYDAERRKIGERSARPPHGPAAP